MAGFFKTTQFNLPNDENREKTRISLQNKLKTQPNCGQSIYNIKGADDGKDILFVNNSQNKNVVDRETNFTWRFGYNDGHPCVFFTFTSINKNLLDSSAFICLETNTLTKGKNISINAYGSGVEEAMSNLTQGITWFPINEIELNKEYCLYIIGFGINYAGNKKTEPSELFGPWKFAKYNNFYRDIPNDWKIHLNVRPSIRLIVGTCHRHHVYRSLPNYQEVEYTLNDEYQL